MVSREPAGTELFPIPLFAWNDRHWYVESARSRRGHRRRAWGQAQHWTLFVVIAALNFVYAHEQVRPNVIALRRLLSPAQTQVYRRLQLQVSSWGRAADPVDLRSGRKGPALWELLENSEVSTERVRADLSPYATTTGRTLPSVKSLFSEVDVSRLRFEGHYAHWPLAEWLGPDLRMAYEEPKVLRRQCPDPSTWDWPPGSHSDAKSLLPFFGALDGVGLLRLVRGTRPNFMQIRAFNNWKNVSKDRLILVRRGPNGAEGKHAGGPATRMPTGPRLDEIRLERHHEALRGSGADRTDMYYQCEVSPERAATNVIGPPLSDESLAGPFAAAYSRLLASEKELRSAARERRGDTFLFDEAARSRWGSAHALSSVKPHVCEPARDSAVHGL